MPPEFGNVIDCRCDSRDQFLHLRAGFPAFGNGIAGGPHLVWLEALQVLALSVERSHVWSEELVRRAHQKIAVQCFHINESVRCKVHRIHEHQRAGFMRESRNFSDGIDRSHQVGSVPDRNELGLPRNLTFQIFQIQRAILFANVHLPDNHAVFLQRTPWRHVRIVVQRGYHDFVARFQLPADCPRQRKRDRGHVLPEDNFNRTAVEKIGHRRPRRGNHRVVSPARFEGTVSVGVCAQQVILDRVHHLLWHLRPRRPVKERRRAAVHFQFQRGKLLAYPGNIECFGFRSLYRRCAHGFIPIASKFPSPAN